MSNLLTICPEKEKGAISQIRKDYLDWFSFTTYDNSALHVDDRLKETNMIHEFNMRQRWKQYAAQNNVVLVTPLTLLAYMRLVYLAWQHQKELDNEHEIVNTARELLTRMNAFLMAFEGIGGAIESLRQVYADAGATLVDSPRAQTIARAANRLIDLHVRLESRKGRRLEKAACLQGC